MKSTAPASPPLVTRPSPHSYLLLLAVGLLVALWLIWPGSPETAVASVQFSPPAGAYQTDQQLVLAAEPGAQIWFTSDGTLPAPANGSLYTQPIHLSAAEPTVTVIRARALWLNGTLSAAVSASYLMQLPANMAAVSLIINPPDLWNEETGIYTHPEAHGLEWERSVDVTYIPANQTSGFHVPAGLRIHGQFSRAYAKKSLRLYFRQEYGLARLFYPFFDQTIGFKRLVLHAGGQDSSQLPTNWTLLRNQLAANLALPTHAHATRSQAVLLYLNGQPWGLYYLREHVDDYWLTEQLGATTAVLADTPARRSENPADLASAYEEWDALTAFVASHDLADPASYDYAQTQVDFANFIDYAIIQMYTANYDWPYTNVKQFHITSPGGRWQWVIWDSDLSLGLKPWSNVEQNTLAQALDPAYSAGTGQETAGRDTILLRALLQNPAFRGRFLARLDELLNTVLLPEAVISQIDQLAAALAPGMAQENGRWGGEPTAWQANVEQLRDFARRRPDILRQHVAASLELPGMAQLTLNPPAEGVGQLRLGETSLTTLPWVGTVLQQSMPLVTAVAAPGYRFAGWVEQPDDRANPLSLPINQNETLTPRFVPWPTSNAVVLSALSPQSLTLTVQQDGLDLRGWRVTDNDSPTAVAEGSLILPTDPVLTAVAAGTRLVLVFAPQQPLPPDDLDGADGQLLLVAGNGRLDANTDPGFVLGSADSLWLYANDSLITTLCAPCLPTTP